MKVRLRLTDGQVLYTGLTVADGVESYVGLKEVLEQHPTGWIDGYADETCQGGMRLVNVAQIVTAQVLR